MEPLSFLRIFQFSSLPLLFVPIVCIFCSLLCLFFMPVWLLPLPPKVVLIPVFEISCWQTKLSYLWIRMKVGGQVGCVIWVGIDLILVKIQIRDKFYFYFFSDSSPLSSTRLTVRPGPWPKKISDDVFFSVLIMWLDMCRKAVHTVSEGGWHAARQWSSTMSVGTIWSHHNSANQRRRRYCLADGWGNIRAEYEHTGTLLRSCELSSILTLAVLRFARICRFFYSWLWPTDIFGTTKVVLAKATKRRGVKRKQKDCLDPS